jgi:hypothetical protein
MAALRISVDRPKAGGAEQPSRNKSADADHYASDQTEAKPELAGGNRRSQKRKTILLLPQGGPGAAGLQPATHADGIQ